MIATLNVAETWSANATLTEVQLDTAMDAIESWTQTCVASIDTLFIGEATTYTYNTATIGLGTTAAAATLTDIANASFSFTPAATGYWNIDSQFLVVFSTATAAAIIQEAFNLAARPTGGTTLYSPGNWIRQEFPTAESDDYYFARVGGLVNLTTATPTTIALQIKGSTCTNIDQHYISVNSSATGESLSIFAYKV